MIHNNIKKVRTLKGFNQQDVADKLHIGLRAYQNIESGETKLDIERLQQIASLLEVNIMDLINTGDNVTISSISNNVGGISNKEVIINHHQSAEEIKILYEKLLNAKDIEISLLKALLNKK